MNLGRWPLRRLNGDEPGELAKKLRKVGVTQAWAGSFDGLLHKDLRAVNAKLAEDCRKHGRGLFMAFGSVNPNAPRWEEELQRCAQEHRMAGIRVHPNYHGYKLNDADFRKMLRMSADHGLVVQLAWIMEDERMMHPLLQVDPVNAGGLTEVVSETPGLRLVLLNALGKLRGATLTKVVKAGEVFVEISMLEGVGGIEKLMMEVPVDRILFGSHAPFFYWEAAKLKLKESALTEDQFRMITRENAKRVLARRS